jgi:hypothetical protein
MALRATPVTPRFAGANLSPRAPNLAHSQFPAPPARAPARANLPPPAPRSPVPAAMRRAARLAGAAALGLGLLRSAAAQPAEGAFSARLAAPGSPCDGLYLGYERACDASSEVRLQAAPAEWTAALVEGSLTLAAARRGRACGAALAASPAPVCGAALAVAAAEPARWAVEELGAGVALTAEVAGCEARALVAECAARIARLGDTAEASAWVLERVGAGAGGEDAAVIIDGGVIDGGNGGGGAGGGAGGAGNPGNGGGQVSAAASQTKHISERPAAHRSPLARQNYCRTGTRARASAPTGTTPTRTRTTPTRTRTTPPTTRRRAATPAAPTAVSAAAPVRPARRPLMRASLTPKLLLPSSASAGTQNANNAANNGQSSRGAGEGAGPNGARGAPPQSLGRAPARRPTLGSRASLTPTRPPLLLSRQWPGPEQRRLAGEPQCRTERWPER